MNNKELLTIFFNHRHTGTRPDARKLDINSLIGAAGSTATILISPNGTRYIVRVDDDGALVTEMFAKAGSLFVTSPSGKKFIIGVESDGALTTEPYEGTYGNYIFTEWVELIDKNGAKFNMGVLDDGTLNTVPA